MKNWITIAEINDGESYGYTYQVDYDKDLGMYRISIFKDNHFQDEIFFDEAEKINLKK